MTVNIRVSVASLSRFTCAETAGAGAPAAATDAEHAELVVNLEAAWDPAALRASIAAPRRPVKRLPPVPPSVLDPAVRGRVVAALRTLIARFQVVRDEHQPLLVNFRKLAPASLRVRSEELMPAWCRLLFIQFRIRGQIQRYKARREWLSKRVAVSLRVTTDSSAGRDSVSVRLTVRGAQPGSKRKAWRVQDFTPLPECALGNFTSLLVTTRILRQVRTRGRHTHIIYCLDSFCFIVPHCD